MSEECEEVTKIEELGFVYYKRCLKNNPSFNGKWFTVHCSICGTLIGYQNGDNVSYGYLCKDCITKEGEKVICRSR